MSNLRNLLMGFGLIAALGCASSKPEVIPIPRQQSMSERIALEIQRKVDLGHSSGSSLTDLPIEGRLRTIAEFFEERYGCAGIDLRYVSQDENSANEQMYARANARMRLNHKCFSGITGYKPKDEFQLLDLETGRLISVAR